MDHVWTYDKGENVHYCFVCDQQKKHTAEHDFTNSECACGLVKLTLTALDMQDGKFVPTFSPAVDGKVTLKVANATVSDDNATVTASGFTLEGADADDYLFVADNSMVIALDAEDLVTVTVKYVCGDEEIQAAASVTYVKGLTYTLDAPLADGYTFASWSVDNPYTAPLSNTEITATYTKDAENPDPDTTGKSSSNNNVALALAIACRNNQKCVVTYKSTGANDHVSATVKKGTVLQMPEVPTKDGYTFIGWYKDINGTKPFDFNSKITGSVSIYAKWAKN